MKQVTLEELLEAGCHFGHQVTRQNPKAREFVFEARDNIHIIDLEKTKEGLDAAVEYVMRLASNPESSMVILGAKRQAQGVVKEEVKRAREEGATGLYRVSNRWIGGILTNFGEVAKNFRRLQELTKNLASEAERSRYTKKEISLWEKEKQKLESFYGGIAEMPKIPNALFIIDTHLEYLAVREARAMGVTTVGITDTNSDPTLIDYPIPANDDAVGSIKLITETIVNAWIEGKKKGKEQAAKEEAAKKEPKEASSEKVSGDKTEKKVKKADHEEKPVELAPAKKKETKKTPEKISVE